MASQVARSHNRAIAALTAVFAVPALLFIGSVARLIVAVS